MRKPLIFLVLLKFILAASPSAAQYRPYRYSIPSGYSVLGRPSGVIEDDGHNDWIVQVAVLRLSNWSMVYAST